jgi:hypothetical protein
MRISNQKLRQIQTVLKQKIFLKELARTGMMVLMPAM